MFIRYGAIDEPIPFKLTLNGAGQDSIVLLLADVKLQIDSNLWVDIGNEITNDGEGFYLWTPTVNTQTQGQILKLNIKATAGNIGLFDENATVYFTGGHPNARFNGT